MGGAIPSAIVDIFTLIDVEAQNEDRNNFYYIVKESEKVNTKCGSFISLTILHLERTKVLKVLKSIWEILIS